MIATVALGGPLAGAAEAVPDEPRGEEEPRPQRPLPPPSIDPPDVAFEVRGCLSETVVAQVVAAIEASRDPAPDVRPTCRDRVQRLGVWLRPVPAIRTDAYDRARERGLAETHVLGDGQGPGGILISSVLVTRTARELRNDLISRKLNDDLEPDRRGKIRVRDVIVKLHSPDRVVTTLKGERSLPGPNARFTASVRDTLTGDRRTSQPSCSSTLDLDIHSGKFFRLGLGLGLIHRLLLWPFSIEGAVLEWYKEPQTDGSDYSGGTGCELSGMLMPPEIPIPGRRKVTLDYTATAVSRRGITATFVPSVRDRETARVRIAGPDRISGDGVAERTFEIVPDEMLFMPATIDRALDVRWTATGAQIASPTLARTKVRLDLRALARGQTRRVELHVRVQDADGAIAEATKPITLHRPPLPRGRHEP